MLSTRTVIAYRDSEISAYWSISDLVAKEASDLGYARETLSATCLSIAQ
ncbi:MAG: hypothetical protein ACRBM6_30105 [Geminicoccales bacterium]